MNFNIGKVNIDLFDHKLQGLIYFAYERNDGCYAIHFMIRRPWSFGFKCNKYDGYRFRSYSFGPVFMISWY